MSEVAQNTFQEGLIMDFNPINTPNKCVSNCLNGTLITYNGNELQLQNDMGNCKIDTAKLPDGYVPVGMKEHGGIIYVAAYNPKTKKGQVGSYPSPQRIFDQNNSYESLDVNLTDILSTDDNNLVWIDNEFKKIPLFQLKSGEQDTFYIGDKFKIEGTLSDTLKALINQGIIKFKLGVLSKDGSIYYINEDKLNINPENGTFFNVQQILNSPYSGKLVLIIEYNTISDFDLKWTYNGYDSITSMTFEGTASSSYGETILIENKYVKSSNKLINLNDKNPSENPSEKLEVYPEEGVISYKIAPYNEVGILKKFMREGVININNIKVNSRSLSNFDYFIADTYVNLQYQFDYYDLNNSEPIKEFKFVFYPINSWEVPSSKPLTKSDIDKMFGNSGIEYVVDRDIYSGSFNDLVYFSNEFKKNTIYVMVCYVSTKNTSDDIVYKNYVYTSKCANILNKTSKEQPKFKVTVNIDEVSTVTPDYITYKYAVYPENTENPAYEPINSISSDLYRKQVNDDKVYIFDTKEIHNYNISQELKVSLDTTITYNDYKFSVNEFMGEINDTNLISQINGTSYTEGNVYNLETVCSTEGGLKYKSKANSDSKSVSVEGLFPIYPDHTGKLFGCNFNAQGTIYNGIAGDDDGIFYGSTLFKDGTNIAGPKIDVGRDDVALTQACKQHGGNINFFFGEGHNNDDASYRINGSQRGWYHPGGKTNELQDTSYWIMAVMQSPSESYHMINIGSTTIKGKCSEGRSPVRADVMMKAILSQLLIAKTSERTIYWKYPSDYIEETQNTESHTTTISTKEGDLDFNINNGTLQNILESISAKLDVTNYLPKFNIDKVDKIFEIKYGEDINVTDTILPHYADAANAISSPTLLEEGYLPGHEDYNSKATIENQRMYIYRGVVNSIDDQGNCTLDVDEKGRYKVEVSQGEKPWYIKNLRLWKLDRDSESPSDVLTEVEFGKDINEYLITDVGCGNITAGSYIDTYNGVYVNTDKVISKEGHWSNDSGSNHAPDLYYALSMKYSLMYDELVDQAFPLPSQDENNTP